WQTVWLERVPATRIGALLWISNLHRWEIELTFTIHGDWQGGLRLAVRLAAGEVVLADDTYAVLHRKMHRRIALSDPGIDDSRNELLWSPESPTIIHAALLLRAADGACIARVESYTAL